MARIRSIKPDFWDDEKLARISLQSNLLFIGIWNFCDDKGVIKRNAAWIKSKVFPAREELRLIDVKNWIEELVQARMLIPFDYENEGYYKVRTWERHQKIDKPNQSKIPVNLLSTIEINSTNIPRTLDDDSCLERKGEERRGKEGRERAKPPSHEEVLNYSLSKNYPLKEVNKFYAHYSANGWVQGKSKASIKDWKAAMNGWMLRCDDFKSEKKEEKVTYSAPKKLCEWTEILVNYT